MLSTFPCESVVTISCRESGFFSLLYFGVMGWRTWSGCRVETEDRLRSRNGSLEEVHMGPEWLICWFERELAAVETCPHELVGAE